MLPLVGCRGGAAPRRRKEEDDSLEAASRRGRARFEGLETYGALLRNNYRRDGKTILNITEDAHGHGHGCTYRNANAPYRVHLDMRTEE